MYFDQIRQIYTYKFIMIFVLVVSFFCYNICNDYYINLLEKYILLTSSYLPISSLQERDQRHVLEFMKGKFKHWWSSTQPILAKRTLASHLTLPNTKRRRHMTLAIQILVWDRHRHLAGLNLLMGFLPSTHNNWISNDNTYRTYWFAFIYLVCSQ